MTAADEIISQLPMDQLAQQVGSDPATTEDAVRLVLPSLFGGLQANVAEGDEQSANLAQALSQHAPSGGDGIDLASVDTADGEKIVQHMFANSPEQAGALQAGGGNSLVAKLLPILAPIVLAYIAKKLQVNPQQNPGGGLPGGDQQGGQGTDWSSTLGPILGGILGGGSGNTGGAFGDVLSQILAGQNPQVPQSDQQSAEPKQDEGGLGGLLGGLLGR